MCEKKNEPNVNSVSFCIELDSLNHQSQIKLLKAQQVLLNAGLDRFAPMASAVLVLELCKCLAKVN